jgi:hypothetical protein
MFGAKRMPVALGVFAPLPFSIAVDPHCYFRHLSSSFLAQDPLSVLNFDFERGYHPSSLI